MAENQNQQKKLNQSKIENHKQHKQGMLLARLGIEGGEGDPRASKKGVSRLGGMGGHHPRQGRR